MEFFNAIGRIFTGTHNGQDERARVQRQFQEWEDKRKAEEEKKRAEAAAKAEREDRYGQEAESFRRSEALISSFQTEIIPFQKPTAPVQSLTNKTSNKCERCDIVIPTGLSSSTVILSRNVSAMCTYLSVGS